MPERFCNHRETSELFRFGSIILYLRLHGRPLQLHLCQINVQVPASVPRSADRYQEDVRILSDLSAVISGPARYRRAGSRTAATNRFRFSFGPGPRIHAASACGPHGGQRRASTSPAPTGAAFTLKIRPTTRTVGRIRAGSAGRSACIPPRPRCRSSAPTPQECRNSCSVNRQDDAAIYAKGCRAPRERSLNPRHHPAAVSG